MSILVNQHSRVMTQGLTGRAGQFHTAACRNYGNGRQCFVAGVNPHKPGQSVDGIPVFATVKEARAETGANVSVIYVPPPFAAAAIDEAVDADLDLVICITRGIPVRDMIRTRRRMEGRRTLLLGPNCPGLLTPGEIRIGILSADSHQRGRIGVVSRSGALAFEAASQLRPFGIGQSTVVGIGGDPVGGLQYVDVLKMFNDDPLTDAVIMVGETGGETSNAAEVECARWVQAHMHKPVVGFIAGAVAAGDEGAADTTLSVMQACGIHVTRNPAEIGKRLAALVMPDYLPFD